MTTIIKITFKKKKKNLTKFMLIFFTQLFNRSVYLGPVLTVLTGKDRIMVKIE